MLAAAADTARYVSGSSTRHVWATALLQAGAGRRRARPDRGWLGQALSILVPAITCGGRPGLRDVKMTDVVVAAAGETSVEVVLPEGRSCLQLSWSGWSWVAGVDAVGGSPHGNSTDDAAVRLADRRCPNRLRAVLTGLISNVTGKVDH